VPVTESDYLVVTFPPEIKLPWDAKLDYAFSSSTSMIDSLSTSVDLSTNQIFIEFNLPSGTASIQVLEQFSFTVGSLMNPNTTAATSDFSLEFFDQYDKSISVSAAGLTLSTTTAALMEEVTVEQASSGASAVTTFTFTFQPLHDLAINSKIVIEYPPQVSIPEEDDFSVRSLSTSDNPVLDIDRVGRRVLISIAFQAAYEGDSDDPVILEIYGFANPASTSLSDSFTLITLTLDGYFVDWINYGLVLNSNCNFPCQGCLVASPSSCTSCFTEGTLAFL